MTEGASDQNQTHGAIDKAERDIQKIAHAVRCRQGLKRAAWDGVRLFRGRPRMPRLGSRIAVRDRSVSRGKAPPLAGGTRLPLDRTGTVRWHADCGDIYRRPGGRGT